MADTKISALTSATTPLAGTEVLPIVQGGVTKQVSIANLTAGRAVSAASLALTTPLPTTSGGTGLSSFNSTGLVWASNTTTLATTTAITVIGGGLGIYFSTENLSGNFWQARYNASNFAMGVATGNASGFPFLGVNVNGSAGSDNGTFDINGWATRLRLDNGVFQIQVSSASGTAGNAITWNTLMTSDTSLRLGLGATPAAKFHVKGDNALDQILDTSNSNGTRMEIRLNGTVHTYFGAAGSIFGSGTTTDTCLVATSGNAIRLGANGNLGVILDTALAFKPGADNTQTLGTGALRWSTVYAGTGTINTSDARHKEQIEDLDDAERRVAQRIKKLVKKFKFRDAVAEKGDKARIHVGVVAQEVMAAFEAEGLDPCQYALFCYDEWGDQFEPVKAPRKFIDENGEEQTELVETGEMQQTQVAGSRFGIRYDELLVFVLAAL